MPKTILYKEGKADITINSQLD